MIRLHTCSNARRGGRVGRGLSACRVAESWHTILRHILKEFQAGAGQTPAVARAHRRIMRCQLRVCAAVGALCASLVLLGIAHGVAATGLLMRNCAGLMIQRQFDSVVRQSWCSQAAASVCWQTVLETRRYAAVEVHATLTMSVSAPTGGAVLTARARVRHAVVCTSMPVAPRAKLSPYVATSPLRRYHQ